MNRKQMEEVVTLAIETYGVSQQLNQVNEELAELIVEVAKNKRGFNNRDKIVEEMGDVLVCFINLAMILEITDEEIKEAMIYKLNRTKERIAQGYDPRKELR